MKFLSSLIVSGIFYTDVVSSYISSSRSDGYAPWTYNPESSFAKPPSNIGLDDIFREEYHAWAKRYGKSTSDESRFENFKLNFMLQMQHNKKTGQFNLLNEFGDSKSKIDFFVLYTKNIMQQNARIKYNFNVPLKLIFSYCSDRKRIRIRKER